MLDALLAPLLSLDQRRRRALARLPPGPLARYLATPFPDPARDCREVEYLSLDLETSGLDPRRDRIVSLGYVVVRGLTIDLGSATHRIIRPGPDHPLSEASVVIHQLTDDTVASGDSLFEAFVELFAALQGRVLLAHHAEIECGFIDNVCRKVCGAPLVVPVVDTQWLARRSLERSNRPYNGSSLRLFNLRENYNLPRYNAHNALSDALATAELFTAQLAEREAKKMPLKDFLRRM